MQQQWWEMVHQQQLVEPLMKTVSTSFTITTVISLMMCCTVPAGPPRQFFGTAKSSTSIIVAWGAPATPNGVITEYQLQCSGGGGSVQLHCDGLTDHNHTEWTPTIHQLLL